LDNIHFIADTGRYKSTYINSFYNGWGNYGQGWANASYVVDPYGRVNLQGLLLPGTRSDGTRIFDMPSNLLPANYMHVPEQGCGFAAIGINPSLGSSMINDKGLGTCYLPVNVLYYPANPTPTPTWTSLIFQNNWVYYNQGLSTPQYTKAADGLVSVKGMIMSGTMTAGLTIATLPSGFHPAARLLFQTYANGASARVDVDTSGNIIYESGSNAWFSLDGLTFYADGS
jgi:hypothetical protein